MELIYANDNCTGCNKCVRDCPVLIANVATDAGKVTVDSEMCIRDSHGIVLVKILRHWQYNIRAYQGFPAAILPKHNRCV